ncbi:hypothetical protein [Haloarchaeobius sp. HRN-SO-5]|uniref:hypothetical protein n=1 Tax=Haloarchaeobius sp. HRN-SO-5 TaxID=3446118 RepID=UPI003EBE67E3
MSDRSTEQVDDSSAADEVIIDPESERALDTCRDACLEARETLNHQIEKIHSEDQKAVAIFRANLLVLGVLTSGLSLSVRTDSVVTSDFLNAHTALGTALLILSCLVSAMTYTSSSFQMGVKPGPVNRVINGEISRREFNETLGKSYAEWIGENQRVHDFNATAISWAISFAIAGLFLYMGGALVGILEIKGDPVSYLLLIGELFAGMAVGACVHYSDELFELIMSVDE